MLSAPSFRLGRRALLALGGTAAFAAAAQTAAAQTATADDIVRQSDFARGGGSSGVVWTIRLVTTGNDDATDGERELAVHAIRTSSLAETLTPVRFRGTKLLQVERNMWLSRPGLSKPIPISPRQRLTGLAANGDIAATNYGADYAANLVREEVARGEPCYVLDLTARGRYTTYDRILYWVSKQRMVAVQAQFLAVSGKLLKSATFDYDNKILVAGRPSPFVSLMTISDALTPAKTAMQYSSVLVQDIPSGMFEVGNL